jgi:hypothetical protein
MWGSASALLKRERDRHVGQGFSPADVNATRMWGSASALLT